MPSTYSTSLRLELMADGEKSGTWGTITNTNLGTLIEQGVAGVASVAHDDSASYTLTTNNGSSDEARNAVVLMTGALTADREVIVPDVDKVYIFKNGTSGGFALTFKTSGGSGVTIPNGRAAICYVDSGTGTVNAIDDGYFTDSIYIEGSSAGDFITAESTNAGATSGPDIKLYRNSASPADSDVLSKITFTANTDNGAGGVSVSDVEYASINVSAPETNETSGEAGKMVIALKRGGTTQNYIEIQGGTSADADNDSIVFKTGGSAVVTIDNSQNVTIANDLTVDTDTLHVDSANNRVGIGTSSPTSTASAGPTLEISGTAGGNLVLSDSNATTGQRAKYFLSQGGALYIGHSADNGTSPVNDLVVDSSGNVGIGTTSPVAPLHVKGDTARFENSAGSYFVGISYDASGSLISQLNSTGHLTLNGGSASGTLRFNTAGSEAMRIDSSGNVGIGTSSPATTVEINGDTGLTVHPTSASTTGVIQIVGTRSSGASAVAVTKIKAIPENPAGNSDAASLAFETRSSSGTVAERMRIDSSGNVGIGVVPTNRFDVTSSAIVVSQFKSSAGGSGARAIHSLSGNGNSVDGLVFISCGSTSTVEGGANAATIRNSENAPLIFGTNNTERMRIDSSGNVSINSTNAEGAKLKVADTQDAVTYPLFLQNRTNTGNSAVGIRFIATGSSVSDGQFAAIRATNALGTGSTANDLEFLTCGSGGTPAVRMNISAGGSTIIRGNNTDSGHYLQVGEFDTAASSQSDGEIKLIHVDDSYVMRVARESGSGDLASTGWYSVAKIPPFGSAGKVTVSLGGDFTADIVVIEWISSHNTALGNSLAEPELRAKATFANVTSPRISNTRIARDSSTGAYYVQVYISSGVNNNTKGKSLLEVYPGRYVETDDGNIQAMFTLFSGSTSHSFECPITTNGSTRTGRQSAPQQPAFHATSGADQTSDGVVSFTSWVSNVGSYYNSSTNRFTAPVAGTYKFSARIMKIASSGRSTVDFAFRKNGAGIGNNLYDTSAGSLEYGSGTINLIAVLAAGDYITVYTSSTTSTNKLHANHREFTGYLIG